MAFFCAAGFPRPLYRVSALPCRGSGSFTRVRPHRDRILLWVDDSVAAFGRAYDAATSGTPLARALDDKPVTCEIPDELGQHVPTVPGPLITGENDDIVPAAGVRQLAADWCRQGATVVAEFSFLIDSVSEEVLAVEVGRLRAATELGEPAPDRRPAP
ncbi:lipase family protein [Nocardia salmonicida]|uniref:lipase family protein n=1 Tax=Nocardia salmonicida TaxID=53431 RepID=UPI0037A4E414